MCTKEQKTENSKLPLGLQLSLVHPPAHHLDLVLFLPVSWTQFCTINLNPDVPRPSHHCTFFLAGSLGFSNISIQILLEFHQPAPKTTWLLLDTLYLILINSVNHTQTYIKTNIFTMYSAMCYWNKNNPTLSLFSLPMSLELSGKLLLLKSLHLVSLVHTYHRVWPFHKWLGQFWKHLSVSPQEIEMGARSVRGPFPLSHPVS